MKYCGTVVRKRHKLGAVFQCEFRMELLLVPVSDLGVVYVTFCIHLVYISLNVYCGCCFHKPWGSMENWLCTRNPVREIVFPSPLLYQSV